MTRPTIASGLIAACLLQASASAAVITLNSVNGRLLDAQVKASAGEAGMKTNLYVGALYHGSVYLRGSQSDDLRLYQSGPLPVAVANYTLPESGIVPLLAADLSGFAGMDIYMGYGASERELALPGHLFKVYTVPAAAVADGRCGSAASSCSTGTSGTATIAGTVTTPTSGTTATSSTTTTSSVATTAGTTATTSTSGSSSTLQPTASSTSWSNLTVANAVNGVITVPAPSCCGSRINITGDGNTSVRLWFPYYWGPALSPAGSDPFMITETHGTGTVISMTGVRNVIFDNGQAFELPGFTPIALPTVGMTTTTTAPSTTTTSSATVILSPAVPQPANAAELVGVALQNATASPTGLQYVTFGQMLKQGAVLPTDTLAARINGASYPAQMDAEALWPDGSVKFAAITLAANVPANAALPILLYKTAAPANAAPVDLLSATVNLTATLNFTGGQYTGTQTVDLGSALKTALQSTPDYWLRGPLATQARVDVRLGNGPLHLTADVTAYADGSVTADVQFNNDLTTLIPAVRYANPGPLAPQKYSATVTLNDKATSFSNLTQYQYQDWHALLASKAQPAINVQHDLAYLEHSGAILPYDRTTGVSSTLLQDFQTHIIQAPDFGAPLAGNGVTKYMPTTGGRPDIGYTTQYNTAWLLTQDARAAAVALAQGDAGGAVPWNIKLANGHWLTKSPDDSASHVWVDVRADQKTVANQPDSAPGWTADNAHQPNLAYVPYLMTAQRWYLDRLNAQAAYSLSADTYVSTCTGDSPFNTACDIVLNQSDQVRGQAWSMREIQEAAFIGKRGSWEQDYFAAAVQHNWDYMQFIINQPWTDPWKQQVKKPALAASQGQAAGWILPINLAGSGDDRSLGATAEWQQDFLTGIAVLGARMGYAGARQFVGWQKDTWLAGRFLGQGMNPHDGCAGGYIQVADPVTGVPNTTWADIEAKTLAQGNSVGSGWSAGYFCPLARASLGGALTLYPEDAYVRQALDWLKASAAPNIDAASFRLDPTFNIVPLQP